ncbi:MAG: hypothetical protein NTZ55_03395 [Candidatus Roizmanbacteria bacterium]|nr:hypothetical protein [Candidatus Roizmanbacteria bacterium]
MKFQHLILPLALWLLVGTSIVFFVPTSPLVVGSVVLLISLASYFSLRTVKHNNAPIVISCCIGIFLLSSVFSGFNLINLLLIAAICTLILILTK